MEMEERRRDKRYDTLNFVHYRLQDADGGTMEYMGRTLDASVRGLLVQAHLPLPIGQTLTLSLGLGEDILELTGEVVHCTDSEEGMYCSGIEFDAMTDDKRAKLKSFLAEFSDAKA